MAKQRQSTQKRQREFQKRQREFNKAEKAAEKRKRREERALGIDASPADDGDESTGSENVPVADDA